MSNLNIKRQEYKYFINNADVYKLSLALDSLMLLDEFSHAITKEYKVTSLYFETPDDDDLDEKLDGILIREKHRMRIYNNQNSTIKLETKKRNGTVISKDSAEVGMSDARDLSVGLYNPDNFDNELAKLICIKLKSKAYKPRVIVEYDRQAYYLPYGNIRITFDKNLRTYNTHTDIFELSSTPKSPVFLDNNQILEIKFEVELPAYLRDVLMTIPSIRSSISKYVLCQRYINHDLKKDHITPSF
jgi:hypothetical protein